MHPVYALITAYLFVGTIAAYVHYTNTKHYDQPTHESGKGSENRYVALAIMLFWLPISIWIGLPDLTNSKLKREQKSSKP